MKHREATPQRRHGVPRRRVLPPGGHLRPSGSGWRRWLKADSWAAEGNRVQETVWAALARWRGRRRQPLRDYAVPALVLLALIAVAACVVSGATRSPWPLAVLPATLAATGVLPLASGPRRLGVASLGAVSLGAALWPGAVLPSVTLAAATTIAAITAWAAGRERDAAAARTAAAHELVDAVSVIDEVTGCYNANGLDLLAQHVLSSVRRSSGAMHACLVEIADLPAVADGGGEDAVRDVVCMVADALRASTRGADVVGRWSPDVFVVLGPGTGVPPAEMERRLRSRLLGASGRPATRWAAAVTVGSGMLEPWDNGGLADLVARAETDLGLRRALRGPSAPAPRGRRRRSTDRAGERPAPER